MNFLTNDKLTIVGAAGMIGSNMAQTALMMNLTPNICLYDPYERGLVGVAEEMYHCAFDGTNLTYTTDYKKALEGAKYIISSGGAPRKQGMTREDLLRGNCQIAEDLGKNIRECCPDVKHVTIIFNPADLTGLVTFLHSGLKPCQVTTLAALDSTRFKSAVAQELKVSQDLVTNCRTYGGHGEEMAVFASKATVDGVPFSEIIGTRIPYTRWEEIKEEIIQGGKKIIEWRGRSSFQSPSYHAVSMIAAAMGGKPYLWPAGCYVKELGDFKNVMMAMPTTIDATGVHYTEVTGTEDEMDALYESYEHLCKMRDEIIELGIIPAIEDWHALNPNA
ncbi:MAG: malate dehydrogenase [Bacteroidales bacterium]|nr:malate dehydrogenase [Bacteroidales bacterium]